MIPLSINNTLWTKALRACKNLLLGGKSTWGFFFANSQCFPEIKPGNPGLRVATVLESGFESWKPWHRWRGREPVFICSWLESWSQSNLNFPESIMAKSFDGLEAMVNWDLKGGVLRQYFSASPSTYDTTSIMSPRQKPRKAFKQRKIPKILDGVASNISLPSRVFNMLTSRVASMSLCSPGQRFCGRRRIVSHVPTCL